MTDVEGGKKAYIPDIVKITIQRILEAIKYKGKPGLLKVEIVYGFDGAGYVPISAFFSCLFTFIFHFSSYSQFGGASMSTDQRNMIHGGLRIFRIVEYDTNKEIFCEDSLDYDTVRPHFLITGSETEERVRMIAAWLDEEIEKAETVFPTYDGKNFSATCKFYLSVDGKVSRMCV